MVTASAAKREAGGRRQRRAAAREPDKQQFNVYLPPALIRRAKHAAVDQPMSLSRLVELAFSAHLDAVEAKRSR